MIIVSIHQKRKDKNQHKEKVLSEEKIVQDQKKERKITKMIGINVKSQKVNRVKINQ